jgi:hypothetical protein
MNLAQNAVSFRKKMGKPVVGDIADFQNAEESHSGILKIMKPSEFLRILHRKAITWTVHFRYQKIGQSIVNSQQELAT